MVGCDIWLLPGFPTRVWAGRGQQPSLTHSSLSTKHHAWHTPVLSKPVASCLTTKWYEGSPVASQASKGMSYLNPRNSAQIHYSQCGEVGDNRQQGPKVGKATRQKERKEQAWRWEHPTHCHCHQDGEQKTQDWLLLRKEVTGSANLLPRKEASWIHLAGLHKQNGN